MLARGKVEHVILITGPTSPGRYTVSENGGMAAPTPTQLRILLRHRVRFEVGATAEASRFVFEAPDGEVAATAAEAVEPLSAGIRAMNADPTVRAWATPAILALRLRAAGSLTSPDGTERQQLLDAGAAIGPTAAQGQALVQAFIEALVAGSPAAATSDESTTTGSGTVRERPSPTPARQFSYRLVAEFADPPVDGHDATVSLRVKPLDRRWSEVPAAELWARDNHHFGAGSREAVSAMLERLAVTWPTAARLDPDDGSGPPPALSVSADELGALADGRCAVSLMANRVEVVWPASLRRDLRSRAVVRRVDDQTDRLPAFSRRRLFRFDWSIQVGGHTLTQQELDTLAGSRTGLVRVRDQWVLVDPRQVAELRDNDGGDLDAIDALRATVTGTLHVAGRQVDVDTVGWLEDVRRRLATRDRDLVPAPAPPGLAGDLREYQLQGLQWMAQLLELGLGGVLADDMGLGKTIMLIALHLHLDAPAPTLVVCPASVLATWEREIQRFAPGVDVVRFHGQGRSLSAVKSGFVVTTYATMRSSVHELRAHDWSLVVADEAQHVKNSSSEAAKALRSIGSDARMALTGTPVENNLAELWSILDWTTPGLLGTREQFRTDWARRIERDLDEQRAGELATLIRPFVLRRRKTDPGIAPELPPKIETDHRVQLTREQVGLYESVVRQALTDIGRTTGLQRRGLVVKLLTQLKQICNHPAHFLGQRGSRLTGRSGKLTAFDDLIDEILAEQGAALVFTQYTVMGELLSRHLASRHVTHQYLHGGTPVRTRERLVRDFQDGQVPVFLLSLRAAGTGLNLTHADHVIHFDRWWNPAVEDQATDRAHRIGQNRAVQVHRLVTEGTIEESIAELIAGKRALADAVVNAGQGALTELSDAELATLVRLRH